MDNDTRFTLFQPGEIAALFASPCSAWLENPEGLIYLGVIQQQTSQPEHPAGTVEPAAPHT